MVKILIYILKDSCKRNGLSAHIWENVKIRTAVIFNNFRFLEKAPWKIKLADKISGLGLVQLKKYIFWIQNGNYESWLKFAVK